MNFRAPRRVRFVASNRSRSSAYGSLISYPLNSWAGVLRDLTQDRRAHMDFSGASRAQSSGPPCSGPHDPSPSLGEALAACALYLDALRGLLYSGSLHPHLQHSVLKAGVDLALVGALRQRHAPSERTEAALPDVVVTTLLFLIDLVLTGDRQDPVLQGDIHILLLEPRKLGTDHQIPILGEHVHGRRPLSELLVSLAPPSATQASKRLVEEAIDLTLRIVKPTEWTQHNPYTSFSLCGPSNRDRSPFSATIIIYPFIQFSNTFIGKFTDFSWVTQ